MAISTYVKRSFKASEMQTFAQILIKDISHQGWDCTSSGFFYVCFTELVRSGVSKLSQQWHSAFHAPQQKQQSLVTRESELHGVQDHNVFIYLQQ